MSDLWRIRELQALAAKALESAGSETLESKRVRAIPDERTIRYYTTIGLIDRPAQMQGRTAFYGRRHVLQLVAIKRLQAAGLSLVQVQEKLSGITTRRLTELAELPRGFFWHEPPSNGNMSEVAKAPIVREAFWAAPAKPAAAFVPTTAAISSVRLPIADGVFLEITGVDLQKLNPAATQLLRPTLERLASELRGLGLVVGESPPAERSIEHDTSTDTSTPGTKEE